MEQLLKSLLASYCLQSRSESEVRIVWVYGDFSATLYIDDCLVCRAKIRPAYHRVVYIVTNTKCRIGTEFSPDDGHIAAQNM
jgi:hypothetical protein